MANNEIFREFIRYFLDPFPQTGKDDVKMGCEPVRIIYGQALNTYASHSHIAKPLPKYIWVEISDFLW